MSKPNPVLIFNPDHKLFHATDTSEYKLNEDRAFYMVKHDMNDDVDITLRAVDELDGYTALMNEFKKVELKTPFRSIDVIGRTRPLIRFIGSGLETDPIIVLKTGSVSISNTYDTSKFWIRIGIALAGIAILLLSVDNCVDRDYASPRVKRDSGPIEIDVPPIHSSPATFFDTLAEWRRNW